MYSREGEVVCGEQKEEERGGRKKEKYEADERV